MDQVKVGIGYDIHRLVPERNLVIGGIEISHGKGSLGHSDGDVLIHAIIDALLGAAGAGDIGMHFPDSDPVYKDISSTVLLKRITNLLNKKGFSIGNIDATVILEKPRLGTYIPRMIQTISSFLEISYDCVNIKAKTNEQFDAIGKGEAISAHAVCLLKKVNNS